MTTGHGLAVASGQTNGLRLAAETQARESNRMVCRKMPLISNMMGQDSSFVKNEKDIAQNKVLLIGSLEAW